MFTNKIETKKIEGYDYDYQYLKKKIIIIPQPLNLKVADKVFRTAIYRYTGYRQLNSLYTAACSVVFKQ